MPRLAGVPPNMSVSDDDAGRPRCTRSIAAAMASRAVSTSSCQPIETAAKRGSSPTIISAALTSSVASWPCVTTTTPMSGARDVDHGARIVACAIRHWRRPGAGRASARRSARAAPWPALRRWPPSDGGRRCSRWRRSGSSCPRGVARKQELRAGRSTFAGRRRVSSKLIAGTRTIGRSRPVRSRSRATKCGLGRKRTSKTRSASSGSPYLKPKLRNVTDKRAACARSRASGP